uniref:Aquaporin n=1 Tax=Helix pomatia TaxID=6536 RepID=A0A1I7PJA2_HELPO|nr:aquaporin [Helix pomatia]
MVSCTELLGTKEAKTSRFVRAVLAEAVGTAMLVIVGCGSVSTLNKGLHPGAETMAVAFSFGFALAMIIWMFGHISGAHVNPCVSIGFLVTGHVSLLKTICYIIAQVAGAIAGAGLLKAIIPSGWQGNLGTTTLDENVTIWQGVIIEVIATFCLVMTVFASCDRLRTDHSGSIALAIGFCVTAMITWMGTTTGGSMNPARSLGPAVVSGVWKHHWIYWLAPIAGGIIAALVYEHIFAEQTKETNTELNTFQYNNLEMQRSGYLDFTLDIPGPGNDKTTSPTDFNKGRRFSAAFILNAFTRNRDRRASTSEGL